MNVVFNHDWEDDKKVDSVNLVGLNREEIATIFFAVGEYKKNLQKTMAEVHSTNQKVSNGVEDEMFLYDEMAKCAKMEYNIRYNGHTDDEVYWLDFG